MVPNSVDQDDVTHTTKHMSYMGIALESVSLSWEAFHVLLLPRELSGLGASFKASLKAPLCELADSVQHTAHLPGISKRALFPTLASFIDLFSAPALALALAVRPLFLGRAAVHA